MAKKHTIDIDIKNNADETAKDFDTLNKSMDNTTKSAKNLDATFEEVYGDLQPLTTRMGEAEDRLYELSLAGDTTSKEFQELLTKVGQYRKVQIQTDIAVDGAAKTMTEKLGSALTGATSGFALAQGSMAIFGSENEALEKSLLKVQGALAIQQGVKGLSDSFKELQIGTKLASVAQAAYTAVVGTSTGALKLFRLALVSTGIGAAVVALGLLIANYEKVSAAIKEAIGWFDKQHVAVKALMVVFMPLIAIIKAVKLAYEALSEGVGRVSAKVTGDSRKMFQKMGEDAKEANAQLLAEQEAANKKALAAAKAYRDERLRIARHIQDMENSLLEDGIDKELEINKVKFERLIKDMKGNSKQKAKQKALLEKQEQEAIQAIKDKYQKIEDDKQKVIDDKEEADAIKLANKLKEVKDANAAFLRTEKENELLEVARKYDVLKAMAQGNADALEEINIARLNAENDINLKYQNEADAAQKVRDDKKKADAKELQDAKIDIAVQGFQLIAGIAEAFAGDDVKRQKRAFQIKKVADIASATVDGYRAVLSTYAQTPGGVILKTIAATIAGGFAALQIGNIASAEFQGGGASDVASSASAGGGGAVSPSFNVVGDSGVNQIAQIQASPSQAFVVSGEVTTSQALDRNRVQNATL